MKELLEIYNSFSCVEERISEIARFVLYKIPGNIIEIGLGYGQITLPLLKVAQTFNQKVIGIDPFEKAIGKVSKEYIEPYPFEKFEKAVAPFDNFILYKEFSDDPTLYSKMINQLPYSFAFVDGLQFIDNVISDLNLMYRLDVKVICVDDMNRNTSWSQVPKAIELFRKDNKQYNLFYPKETKECYLISKEVFE